MTISNISGNYIYAYYYIDSCRLGTIFDNMCCGDYDYSCKCCCVCELLAFCVASLKQSNRLSERYSSCNRIFLSFTWGCVQKIFHNRGVSTLGTFMRNGSKVVAKW